MPYFNFAIKKPSFGFGILRVTTMVISALSAADYEIKARDDKGNTYNISKRVMRKLLANYKDLLDEFNKKIEEIENSKEINYIGNKEYLLFKIYLNKINDRLEGK